MQEKRKFMAAVLAETQREMSVAVDLLGIATRTSLLVHGLIYLSLSFGLILINESAGVAWLAIHLLLVVAALGLASHNRFALTKRW